MPKIEAVLENFLVFVDGQLFTDSKYFGYMASGDYDVIKDEGDTFVVFMVNIRPRSIVNIVSTNNRYVFIKEERGWKQLVKND